VAEVAAAHKEAEILVNVQGDMPLIDPAAIDAAIEALGEDESVNMATLAVPISNAAEIMDPNVVKTVVDFDGNALYFSRAPIPWVRDRGGPVHAKHLKHLGLYVFRREALLEFATFPQGDLERIEQLEQLRWLENGNRIRVAEIEQESVEVDTPEDVKRVEKMLASGAGA
jgi:3-deoxy-manno-octulosonate cytidylyltransferase (CMP-KDO synthetase)